MTVIAPGPSLTAEDANRPDGPVVAVGDAWRLRPTAEVLYHADHDWWDRHRGVPEFRGEKWIQDKPDRRDVLLGAAAAERWGLRCVRGESRRGFSLDPALIHHGLNSGFQAVNLAVLLALVPERIVLLGFDMKPGADGRRHFFGEHPQGLRPTPVGDYAAFAAAFALAAPTLAGAGIDVVNCTRDTALTCFRRAPLEEVFPC